MGIGGGFGPSSGRLVEANESYKARAEWTTRAMPPLAGILSLTAAFLAFVFGATLLYDNERILGSVLLVVAVTLVALPVFWTLKNR